VFNSIFFKTIDKLNKSNARSGIHHVLIHIDISAPDACADVVGERAGAYIMEIKWRGSWSYRLYRLYDEEKIKLEVV